MSVQTYKRTAPVAECVRLGLNTATAQRDEITAKAAMREIPDNLQSLAADMEVPPGCQGVPLVANVETAWTRKGDAEPREVELITFYLETEFASDAFKRHLVVVDPRHDGQQSHLAQVHGMGTSNAAIGLGPADCSGQCLILSRVARAADDPVRSCYPVRMSALRYGAHANDVYYAENGKTGRATVQGDLMVYPDPRPDAKCPYAAAFVGYDEKNAVAEPTSAATFKPYLNTFAEATQNSLLDDSKWALDPDPSVSGGPADLCDSLLDDVHDNLRRVAELTGRTYEAVLGTSCVIYKFWGLRDEIRQISGAICVDGTPFHQALADAYLPYNSPTRAVVREQLGVRMPDPTRAHMVFGDQVVDFKNGHWLQRALAMGTLSPVCFGSNFGHGPKGRVWLSENKTLAVEAYMAMPCELFKEGVKDSSVAVHMCSGLAIGGRGDYANGRVVRTVLQERITEGTRKLIGLFKQGSFKSWSSALHQYLGDLVPHTKAWTLEEAKMLGEAFKDLSDLYESNAKHCATQAAKAAAKAKASAEYDAWLAGAPDSTPFERSWHKFEAFCRAGGNEFKTAISQIGYLIAGCGIHYVVTVLDPDLPVDKSKTTILGEAAASIELCEALPRLNAMVLLRLCNVVKGWKEAELAERERVEREAREQRQREAALRAARIAQGALALGREEEQGRKKQAAKDQHAKVSRMSNLGCCPQRIQGNQTTIKFVALVWQPDGRKRTETVAIMDKETALSQLRAGALKITQGPGQGRYFIFKGHPAAGELFNSRGGVETEVVENHSPPPAPPPPPPAAPPALMPPPSVASAVAPPAPAPAEPQYGWLTKRLSDGTEFAFAVPLASCTNEYAMQLVGTAFDPKIEAFVSGVRAHPDIEACFTREEGWLALMQPGGVPTQLRIVPVIRPADGSRMPAAWSERGSDGIAQIWTVYMNVEREAHQNVTANSKVPEEMREAFMGYKIARAAVKAYLTAVGGGVAPDRNYEDAVVGLLLSGSFNSALFPVAHKVVGANLDQRGVAASCLGKRKAPEPAPEATTGGEGEGEECAPTPPWAPPEDGAGDEGEGAGTSGAAGPSSAGADADAGVVQMDDE